MKTQQYGTVLHWGDFDEMDRKSMYSKKYEESEACLHYERNVKYSIEPKEQPGSSVLKC